MNADSIGFADRARAGTANSVTLTTSYSHRAGTIALSIRFERRCSTVSVNSVASSAKHQAIVTVLSRTKRLTDDLRRSTPESSGRAEIGFPTFCGQNVLS